MWLILGNPILIDIPGGEHLVHFWPGIIEKHEVSPPPTRGCDEADPEVRYRVKIVSLDRTYYIPQWSISPFQAHSADESIPWIPCDESHVSSLRGFDPFPQWLTPHGAASTANPPTANALLTLFSFDVKFAKTLASLWSVEVLRSSTCPVGGRGAVTPAGRSDPDDIPQRPGTLPSNPIVAGPAPEWEFWWGAESVRPGDFLRLSFTESGFNYTAAASACLSDGLLTVGDHKEGLQSRSQGCMFLRLRTVIAVQRHPTETRKTLHVVGQLYRLELAISCTKPKSPKIPDYDEGGLPLPPEGYSFCGVLASGWEVQLSLRFVRGRYYPRLKSMLGDLAGLDVGFVRTMEGLATCVTVTPRYNVTGSREEMVKRARLTDFQE